MHPGEHGAWTPLPTSADPVELRRPDDQRPLFFMHIPRTGGFTLKHLLQDVYGTRHTLLDLHKYDHTDVDPALYDVMEGHVGFRKARRMAGAPNTVTIVREPIARTVSVARHLRQYGAPERFRPLQSGKAKPRDIFKALPEVSNSQVKQLANRLPRHESLPEHLPWACGVLDAVAFGLTDEFSVSIALMAERFALRLPTFGVTNASKESGDRDLRSQQFRELAAEHNQLDQQLYDHARSLFRSRRDRYVELLQAMSLHPGQLSGDLKVDKSSAWDVLTLPGAPTEVDLHGWLLVDGRAADAVLADGGAGRVPVLARLSAHSAAWTTRNQRNLYAGVSGKVLVAPDADGLTIEAYDRTEGVRACHTVPIRRR